MSDTDLHSTVARIDEKVCEIHRRLFGANGGTGDIEKLQDRCKRLEAWRDTIIGMGAAVTIALALWQAVK